MRFHALRRVVYFYSVLAFCAVVDGCLINKAKLVTTDDGETQINTKVLIPIKRHFLSKAELEALILAPWVVETTTATTTTTTTITAARMRPTIILRWTTTPTTTTTTPKTVPATVGLIPFELEQQIYIYPRRFFKVARIRSCKYTGTPPIVSSSCDYKIKLFLKKMHWDPTNGATRSTWPIDFNSTTATPTSIGRFRGRYPKTTTKTTTTLSNAVAEMGEEAIMTTAPRFFSSGDYYDITNDILRII